MYSSHKIGAFAIEPRERFLYAGEADGAVLAVSIDDFRIVDRVRGQHGTIEVVAAHPSLPYVAAMAMDRTVALYARRDDGSLALLDRFGFRDVPCANDPDPVPANYSLSQALTFHPTEKRLATRSGNAGVLEMAFPEDRLVPLNCARFHDDIDLVTLRYLDEGDALISAGGGKAVLSRAGELLRTWKFGDFNLHWFEPLGGDEYLVACDDRYVIRLDAHDRRAPLIGAAFARDDLEHSTYNHGSGRAFAAGFDGDLYEVDPVTCEAIGVVWRAPFKMRWIETLEHAPDTLVVHCFNGALYKVHLPTRSILAELRRTPFAIWTAAQTGDTLWFAGEGPSVRGVTLGGVNPMTGGTITALNGAITKGNGESYTKRMVPYRDGLLLAQKSGQLLEAGPGGVRPVIDLGEDVRDLAVDPARGIAFACTEQARVHRIDVAAGETLNSFQGEDGQPIWSLAWHEHRNLLAFAGRRGTLTVTDATSLHPLITGGVTARPKRMKWCGDTLFFVQTEMLRRLDLDTMQISPFIASCENTIEDFIWDRERRYLLLVGYRTEIVLCDFATGAKLSIVPDQPDFTKGVAWIDPPEGEEAYDLDFVTYGRAGTAFRYRIHNERCVAMGPIAPPLL